MFINYNNMFSTIYFARFYVLDGDEHMKKEEFCIMPIDLNYSTKRTAYYCERHEVFFGRAYRKKSIKDGLIVFLTPQLHRGDYGVHGKYGKDFNLYLKQIGQRAWQEYYNKTKEDFIARYGKNYL